MGMQEYEEGLALIEDELDGSDFESQPEERVDRAEAALGVRFPPTYRRFLKELGSGGLGSEEIYGLVNDDFDSARPPQAVGTTLEMRRDGYIPDDVVVIYGLGDGTYYGLQTSSVGPDGECPVVGFVPGAQAAGEELEVVHPDFGHFFLDTMRFEVG
jgi:hypothetical protein